MFRPAFYIGLSLLVISGLLLLLFWSGQPERESPTPIEGADRQPFIEPFTKVTSVGEPGLASWVPGAGLPDGGPDDKRFGLVLVAPSHGTVGAKVEGIDDLRSFGGAFGFDFRNDSPCTETSPAIVITWTDGTAKSYGCATGHHRPAPQDPEHWTRVRFDPPANVLGGNAPPVSDIRIVFNEPIKSVAIDNFHFITHTIGWPGLSVYVADTGNNRIVRIDNWTASGWVAKWTAFGALGSGVNELRGPSDVAVDAAGRIYIADTGNARIVRINDMTGAGWVALGTGTCGLGVGEFCVPLSVAIDAWGGIYVAENERTIPEPFVERVIRINDMSGAGWTMLGAIGFPRGGQFSGPRAIRIDGAGRLYVAEVFSQKVDRMDDLTGAGWVTRLPEDCTHQWEQPIYLALDTSGRIYVLAGTLQRWNDMAGAGCEVAFNLGSQEPTGNGVAIDVYNRIYTTDGWGGWDSGHNRVRRMNDMSTAGWITLGSFGSNLGQFNHPTGIAVDGRGPSPFRGP